MNLQEIGVYVLLAGAVFFLLYKYLKPKKKQSHDGDCNCEP